MSRVAVLPLDEAVLAWLHRRSVDPIVLAGRESDVRVDSVLLAVDRVPVAAFGATIRWPGAADLWGSVDAEALESFHVRRALVREGRELLNGFAYAHGLQVMAAWITTPTTRRFAEAFGFRDEQGPFQAIGPGGDDMTMMVRRWGVH